MKMPPNNILAASILFIKGGASAGFKICNSGLSNSKSAVLSFAYPCTRSMTSSYMQRCKRSSKTMHILSASVSSLSDASADSKARAPFSAPKSAFDDSITSDPNLLNDESWGSLGLTTDMVKALKEMELTDPTPVQRMAIPTIMGGKTKANVSFAAATGSGKTLAYLLPIMQALKAEEELHANALKASDDHHSMKPLRRPKRARAIILTPTRELSRQILSVIKQVSHHCKLSSVGVIGGEDYGKQRKALDRPVDIVVASPGRLLKHRDAGHVYLGSVSHVVIDEVDTMLEQGFQGDVAKIIHPMLYKNNGAGNLVDTAPQLIMTSATITPAVRRLLNGEVKQVQNKKQPGQTLVLPPNLKMLEAPGLHRAVPRLRQVFVDVGSSDKLSLLIDVLSGGGSGAALQTRDRLHDSEQSQALTIVFCNTVASARAAEHALAEAGLMTLSYHGDLGSTDRSENLNKFRSPTDASNILVATDIAARGLDVPAVDHVVMFDFPLNSIDYLHRAGRTARGVNQRDIQGNPQGRAGSGRVTALVMKRDKVLAKAIEGAVQRGEPLDALSSRKSDYLPGGKLGGQSQKPKAKRIQNQTFGKKNSRKKKTRRS